MESLPAVPAAERRTEDRHRDRKVGLAIIAGAFVASLGISFWAKHKSEPERSLPPAPPTSVGVVGWPKAIDPVATLPRAQDLTRRLIFRGFVADAVKSDGTLDITTGGGSVLYSFESARGQGPQLPREPGVVPRKDLCGRQKVRIDPRGIYADNDRPGVACGANPVETLPAPRCTLARVWQLAQRRGAPAGQPARIEYYRAHAGPAFRFDSFDGTVRFSVYGDCGRTLSAAEAAGFVP